MTKYACAQLAWQRRRIATMASIWNEEDIKETLPCEEFSEFKEALQQMRAVDDRIIYRLNTSVPTISFADQVSASAECKALYEQLQRVYSSREKAIKTCVDETSANVSRLSAAREAATSADRDDFVRQLRKEQTKLRLMKVELGVEDVVKDRSMKVFNERCWRAFKPTAS